MKHYLSEREIYEISQEYEKNNPTESWLGKWICGKCGVITTEPGFVTPQSGIDCPEALCQSCEDVEKLNDLYNQ